VTRGQLPQRAGSLGLTAVGLPPRYPRNANLKIWNIQIQGLSRTLKDLLCFQGLSRAWNFFYKIQGLLKDLMNPERNKKCREVLPYVAWSMTDNR